MSDSYNRLAISALLHAARLEVDAIHEDKVAGILSRLESDFYNDALSNDDSPRPFKAAELKAGAGNAAFESVWGVLGE